MVLRLLSGQDSRAAGSGGRKSRVHKAILAGAAILIGTSAATSALAQCVETFNITGIDPNGVPTPAAQFFPLGNGTALSSFIATTNTINTAFLTNTSAFVSPSTGGVWVRGIAGSTETKTKSSATMDTSGAVFGPFVAPTGNQTCSSTVKQDYAGVQIGGDIGLIRGGSTGPNLSIGATGGYFHARTKDTTPGGTYNNPFSLAAPGLFSTPAGTFSETSAIPFAGVYAMFSQNGFIWDALGRVDFYQNALTDPANGLRDQSSDARGLSFTTNVAYTIPIGNSGIFIEPGAGFIVSRVSVDTVAVPGVGGLGTGFVSVNDIDSRLGRLALTLGTSFRSSGIGWSPYVTASVFHEFAGNVVATSTISGSATTGEGIHLISSIGRVGTYGQIALGTSAVFGDTGWLGYARVDYRKGENIEGVSGTLGLRYQFNTPR
jgi:hypothetical protein